MRYLLRMFLVVGVVSSAVAARPADHPVRTISAPIAVIPFEMANKSIYVRVVVASRPLWFVLDTGDKYTVIDLGVARTLGLALGDPVQVGGGGNHQVMGNLMKGGSVAIPQVNDLDLPLFIGVPLEDIANASGHEFAGILGFDFISKYVVEIDYGKRRLILHDPGTYRYEGPGESFPITFNTAGHPRVHARIVDGHQPPVEGLFVLDTGSGATIILDQQFVEAQHFVDDRRTVPWLAGLGFGGGIEGRVGRLSALQLGRTTIAHPIAIFSQARTGAFAGVEEQGNIGAAILEKFRVILDYPHNRVILEPTDALAKPLDYNKAGLMLVSTGGNYRSYKVSSVADRSPASEVGIQAGDEILLVDGKPAGERSLSTLRERLQERGPVRLTLRRGGKLFRVLLKPRRMI